LQAAIDLRADYRRVEHEQRGLGRLARWTGTTGRVLYVFAKGALCAVAYHRR